MIRFPGSDADSVYFTSAAAVAVAKAATFASAFVALWAATGILSKDEFGSYAVALSIMWLAGVVAAQGLDKAALYRLSSTRVPLKGGGRRVAGYFARILSAGLVIAAAFVAAGYLAPPSAALPDLGYWMASLALLVPLQAAGVLAAETARAAGRIAASQLVPASGQILRAGVLATGMLSAGGAGWVVAAELGAALFVCVLQCLLLPYALRRLPGPVTRADLAFGRRSMASRLFEEGTRRLDLVLVGALAAGSAAASYAVASRLAVVSELGRDLLQPAAVPRIRAALREGAIADAEADYEAVAGVSLLVSLALSAAIAICGPFLLPLLGDYADAYPPLLILTAALTLNAGAGPNAATLSQAGRPGDVARLRLHALILMAIVAAASIAPLGARGAACGVLTAITYVNVRSAILLRADPGLRTVTSTRLVAVGAGVAALALTAFGATAPAAGALICLLAAAYVAPSALRNFRKLSSRKPAAVAI